MSNRNRVFHPNKIETKAMKKRENHSLINFQKINQAELLISKNPNRKQRRAIKKVVRPLAKASPSCCDKEKSRSELFGWIK